MNGGILITFFKDFYAKEVLDRFKLNKRQVEALELWYNRGEITSKEYGEHFQITDRTARRDLSELSRIGLVIKIGENKGVKYLLRK